ncbi:MAG: carbohydrate ABC transporter permease [Spirochaetaceae bacterium]|nr:carbohydrate ABC transporter permease [Spirochaetaceae bacterium]
MIRDVSISGRTSWVVVHLMVLSVLLTTLYPVLHIASVSFSDDVSVMGNRVTFFPVNFNVRAYQLIFSSPLIPNSFKNAVIYTVVGTIVNMLLTTPMAYALSKRRLAFRGVITAMVIVTFFFSGGLIPTFLLVRGLGMYNTIWALAVPTAIATWNLIIMRTFFQTLPQELEDSAVVDGANDITVFWKIMLPISQAAVATITLFYAVSHWNSWFPAVVYFSKAERYPLQVILRQIVIENQMTEALLERGEMAAARAMDEEQSDQLIASVDRIKFATLFASIVPMLIIYPFIQRYFVRGLMIGSLKG